jgi:hypothetical protein
MIGITWIIVVVSFILEICVYMSVFVSIYEYIYIGVYAFVFVYGHNKFIYTYIISILDYLRLKWIYLINSNDKILTIIN